jgi:pimeloyl-ACP methyl ester carboxylesterase
MTSRSQSHRVRCAGGALGLVTGLAGIWRGLAGEDSQLWTWVGLALAVVSAVLLVSCRSGSGGSDLAQRERDISAVQAEVGAITPVACPLLPAGEVEGETVDCFVYTVPVNYDDPAAGTINLTVVRLRAQSESPLPDPIVYLAGGPGQSGVVAAGGNLYGDLRRERDILFPAQRGTLFAQRLGLEECVTLLGNELGRDELEAFVESVGQNASSDRSQPYDEYLANYSRTVGAVNSRCHEAFKKAGYDPAQFTTANSTRDLVGMMQALGYTSYNLHGTSYGTRLALETMRRHPDAPIRSVVLDSPVAPTVDRLRSIAVAPHDTVMQLFANCAADSACAAAYPDLSARTAALLAKLAATPLTAGERTIGPAELLDQLRDLGGTRGNYLPRMIAELEAGDTATYLALANAEIGTRSPEGSATSGAVADLLQKISIAGLKGSNPLTGIQAVADVLTGAREADPRAGMKAAAERVLADSDSLPQILEAIDNLSEEDVLVLRDSAPGAGAPVDQAAVNRVMEANARNNAHFLLSGIGCLEQLAFADARAAIAARDALPIPALGTPDAALATEVGNCADYPMGDGDTRYHEPVTSAVPTLILQGEYDTRTPPAHGRAVAEQLANATLAFIPQAGHETWGSGNCVARIGIEFIRDPQQAPDLSCLEIRRHRFSLPGDALE